MGVDDRKPSAKGLVGLCRRSARESPNDLVFTRSDALILGRTSARADRFMNCFIKRYCFHRTECAFLKYS